MSQQAEEHFMKLKGNNCANGAKYELKKLIDREKAGYPH